MEQITLGHGSGGRLTEQLIKGITGFFPKKGIITDTSDLEDCAFIKDGIAVTIDSFTVSPRTFPGGNIGKLAVCGSTNDLAVRGVRPEWLTMSVVIEEGLSREEFDEYMLSAAKICEKLGVTLSAGDTKVVPRNSVDGLFITTCALGISYTPFFWGINNIKPEDRIAVTRSIGSHGATIGASRYDLGTSSLRSDCAALWPAIESITQDPSVRAMRDCTRGGLGTVLCEWAEGSGLGIEIHEDSIPIDPDVTSVCDILGFDPLYLACEGCAAIAFDPEGEDRILSALSRHDECRGIAVIGEVVDKHEKIVGMETSIGGMRVIDMPVAEMLPRIC